MTSLGLAEEIDILLVEDNPNDAEFALRALRKAGSAPRILHLDDGAKALDYMFCTGSWAGRNASLPRVVLLDLKLPKFDGLEVLRRLKADRRTCAVPVVILTSSREARDLDESYRDGVNSYVVKPVNFEAFTRALSELARYWVEINQVPARSPGA